MNGGAIYGGTNLTNKGIRVKRIGRARIFDEKRGTNDFCA
jgi:hypothetical protein